MKSKILAVSDENWRELAKMDLLSLPEKERERLLVRVFQAHPDIVAGQMENSLAADMVYLQGLFKEGYAGFYLQEYLDDFITRKLLKPLNPENLEGKFAVFRAVICACQSHGFAYPEKTGYRFMEKVCSYLIDHEAVFNWLTKDSRDLVLTAWAFDLCLEEPYLYRLLDLSEKMIRDHPHDPEALAQCVCLQAQTLLAMKDYNRLRKLYERYRHLYGVYVWFREYGGETVMKNALRDLKDPAEKWAVCQDLYRYYQKKDEPEKGLALLWEYVTDIVPGDPQAYQILKEKLNRRQFEKLNRALEQMHMRYQNRADLLKAQGRSGDLFSYLAVHDMVDYLDMNGADLIALSRKGYGECLLYLARRHFQNLAETADYEAVMKPLNLLWAHGYQDIADEVYLDALEKYDDSREIIAGLISHARRVMI